MFAGLALIRPESFAWFTTQYFTGFLGALMLSMGITLTADDFTRVVKEPGAVVVGFLLCYGLCPLLGLGLGKAFALPVDLVAGLVLVGSINGGQASNLCTYIARGDVALSVLMTTVTTIAGIVATPLLCKLLLGAVVPVDAVGIALSCIQVGLYYHSSQLRKGRIELVKNHCVLSKYTTSATSSNILYAVVYVYGTEGCIGPYRSGYGC